MCCSAPLFDPLESRRIDMLRCRSASNPRAEQEPRRVGQRTMVLAPAVRRKSAAGAPVPGREEAARAPYCRAFTASPASQASTWLSSSGESAKEIRPGAGTRMETVRRERPGQRPGIRARQHDMRAAARGRQRVRFAERAQKHRRQGARLPAERLDIGARELVERAVQRRERQCGRRGQRFERAGECPGRMDPGGRAGAAAEEAAAPPDRRLHARALQRRRHDARSLREVEGGERARLAGLPGKRGDVAERARRRVEAADQQQRAAVEPGLGRLRLRDGAALCGEPGQQGGKLSRRGQNALAAGGRGGIGEHFQRIVRRGGEAQLLRRRAQERRQLLRRRPGEPAAVREARAPLDMHEAREPRPHLARQRPEPVAVQPQRPGRQEEAVAQIGERVAGIQRHAVRPRRHRSPNSSSAARRAMPALSWPTPGAV